jgi:hypothetical protein
MPVTPNFGNNKEKNMATKKAAAPRKAAVKKTVAEPTPSDSPPDSAPIPQSSATTSVDAAVSAAAVETLRNSQIWGTGRERDLRLKKAGLDPKAVAAERNRLRAEQRKNNS